MTAKLQHAGHVQRPLPSRRQKIKMKRRNNLSSERSTYTLAIQSNSAAYPRGTLDCVGADRRIPCRMVFAQIPRSVRLPREKIRFHSPYRGCGLTSCGLACRPTPSRARGHKQPKIRPLTQDFLRRQSIVIYRINTSCNNEQRVLPQKSANKAGEGRSSMGEAQVLNNRNLTF